MRIVFTLLTILGTIVSVFAQDADSLLSAQPLVEIDNAIGSTSGYRLFLPSGSLETSSVYGPYSGERIASDLLFRAASPVLYIPEQMRVVQRIEWKFYMLCGIVFFLALLRQLFPKYFTDLFTVFFNTTVRQKQLREQLGQSLLPSLLMSLFYCVTGGTFLYLTEPYLGLDGRFPVTGSILLWFSFLAALYVAKYLLMEFLGWVFQAGEACRHYLFVVFTVNRIAGLYLLPFVVLMAYTGGGAQKIILKLALAGLGILIMARLVRGFQAIQPILRIPLLHYLLFVAAFEIMPVLVVCKLLVQFIA
jgi:hypothetical protein